MTSVTVPSQSDLYLDARLERMDTGQGILDSPREYTTDSEVSVLDLTELDGIPLDDPEEGGEERGEERGEEVAIYYDEEEDVYWMDIIMDMTSVDERFGFSVMGGVEEGFLPRVDEISIGAESQESCEESAVRGCQCSGLTNRSMHEPFCSGTITGKYCEFASRLYERGVVWAALG